MYVDPIDCSKHSICHLIWLTRYDFSYDYVLKCSNGASFNDLDSVGFIHCPDYALLDYAPCNFSNRSVTCQSISILKIQKIFRQTARPSFDLIVLTFSSMDRFIPKDVFSDKKTTKLVIQYAESTSLEVDHEAFTSTKQYTKKVILNRIECSLLNLNFLSGFGQLKSLTFANMNNIHNCLPTLPFLPNLTKLRFDNCLGMHQLKNFPKLTKRLESLTVFGHENSIENLWDDATISRVLDWLIDSSVNALEELQFGNLKQMTQVPRQISSFKALTNLWMFNTSISSIRSGTLLFSGSVLGIVANGLKEIEPDAMQGTFFVLISPVI